MTGVGGGSFAIVCVKASWAGPQQQLLCQAYPQPGGRREPARAVELSFFRLPSRVIMAVRTCQAWVPSECRKRVPIIKGPCSSQRPSVENKNRESFIVRHGWGGKVVLGWCLSSGSLGGCVSRGRWIDRDEWQSKRRQT